MTPVHPYAELFPMMADAELASMAESIKANGQEHKIIYDQHGRLVDGRNRLRACEMAGVEPASETRHFPDGAAVLRFVCSMNWHRRNLNESQRGMVAASIANAREGGNGSNRHVKRATPSIDGVAATVTQEQAANLLNVSEKTVERAATVLRSGTPELQQAVRQGEVTVNAAAKIARLPPAEQPEALAEERGGKSKPKEKLPEPTLEERKRSKGIELANEALNCLKRIPKNDALRKHGFRLVTDWIRLHQ